MLQILVLGELCMHTSQHDVVFHLQVGVGSSEVGSRKGHSQPTKRLDHPTHRIIASSHHSQDTCLLRICAKHSGAGVSPSPNPGAKVSCATSPPAPRPPGPCKHVFAPREDRPARQTSAPGSSARWWAMPLPRGRWSRARSWRTRPTCSVNRRVCHSRVSGCAGAMKTRQRGTGEGGGCRTG